MVRAFKNATQNHTNEVRENKEMNRIKIGMSNE